MSTTKKFDLTRHFPDGTVAIVPGVTKAKVRMHISMFLVYNGVATRKQADAFAHSVTSGQIGTVYTYSEGWAASFKPAAEATVPFG